MSNKSPLFKKVSSVLTPIRTYGKRKPTVQIISSSPNSSRDNESDSQSQSQGALSDDYKISFSSQDSLLEELYDKSNFSTKFADGGFAADFEDDDWKFDSPPRSRDSITNSGGSEKSASSKFDFEDDDDESFESPKTTPTNSKSKKRKISIEKTEKSPEKGKKGRKKTKLEEDIQMLEESPKKSKLEMQAEAETSEIKDDIDYILDGLSRPKQTASAKARSIYTLAKMCKQKSTAIGQILRFSEKLPSLLSLLEETLDEVCKNTSRTQEDEALRMASAALMNFLLRDPLNADAINVACIESLLKVASERSKEQINDPLSFKGKVSASLMQDVRLLFGDEDETEGMDSSSIAIQALVNVIGFEKGKESVKNSLRDLGVFDILIDLMKSTFEDVKTLSSTDDRLGSKFSELDTYLKIIENSTFVNSKNQIYLSSEGFMDTLFKFITFYQGKAFGKQRQENNIIELYTECLLCVLRVLVNLSNDNEKAITYFHESKLQPLSIMMQLCVNIDSIPEDTLAFDVQQLTIALFSNVIEKSDANRIALRDVDMKKITKQRTSSCAFFVQLFNKKLNRTMKTRNSLEKSEKESKIACAYVALLLGLLCLDPKAQELILKELPDHTFKELIGVIEDFILFQIKAGILTKEANESYNQILERLRSHSSNQ